MPQLKTALLGNAKSINLSENLCTRLIGANKLRLWMKLVPHPRQVANINQYYLFYAILLNLVNALQQILQRT